MSLVTPAGNVELMRALKRMGIDPHRTDMIAILIEPNKPVHVYVRRTGDDVNQVADMVLSIIEGDFQVVVTTEGKTDDGASGNGTDSAGASAGTHHA